MILFMWNNNILLIVCLSICSCTNIHKANSKMVVSDLLLKSKSTLAVEGNRFLIYEKNYDYKRDTFITISIHEFTYNDDSVSYKLIPNLPECDISYYMKKNEILISDLSSYNSDDSALTKGLFSITQNAINCYQVTFYKSRATFQLPQEWTSMSKVNSFSFMLPKFNNKSFVLVFAKYNLAGSEVVNAFIYCSD